MTGESLLEVKNLKKYYPVKAGVFRRTVDYIKAVDDISFTINEGETLGLVGESGCGKSTAGTTLLRLEEATEGEVYFDGRDVLNLDRRELRRIRREMQIIFQDPYASLNPRMKVESIIGEPLDIHNLANSKQERKERIEELLESVGLSADQMSRYPHEFSGGQRQRIGIARALAVNPRLVIADEPVSALDVSVQAQVINLLQDLQDEFGLTYLFIAHDLSVVKHISDRVIVMYLGKIVELADKRSLYNEPLHPYTISLLSAIPEAKPGHKKDRIILEGDVPSPVNPPSGCRFHPRCPRAKDVCSRLEPDFIDYGEGHFAACHFVNKKS
ncbi:MAG: ABC transporter ATP-binding protein [Halanaerobiaceae bacterium]